VLADLDGVIDAVLDAGPCDVGVESTIIACLGGAPRLLRPGAVTRAEAERVLGCSLAEGLDDASAPVAPGQLASHYAPRARLRLNATAPREDEAWLGFGPDPVADGGGSRANLSPSGDLVEAASRLFALLRQLDASGAAVIAVAPIPRQGLGEAIRDRLDRAAAPR
jgi:L-threonylcarbamoyladenylate synthase